MPRSPLRLAINAAHERLIDSLKGMGLTGLSVLDIGGGASMRPTPRERQWAAVSKKFDILDMNPKHGPDIVCDIEAGAPIEDGAYDVVLCGQVLEHTFNFINVINECKRMASGLCVIDVPFMYHYHKAPEDYWRISDAALARLFHAVGFPAFATTMLCSRSATWGLATMDPATYDLKKLIGTEGVDDNGGSDSERDCVGGNGNLAAAG